MASEGSDNTLYSTSKLLELKKKMQIYTVSHKSEYTPHISATNLV